MGVPLLASIDVSVHFPCSGGGLAREWPEHEQQRQQWERGPQPPGVDVVESRLVNELVTKLPFRKAPFISPLPLWQASKAFQESTVQVPATARSKRFDQSFVRALRSSLKLSWRLRLCLSIKEQISQCHSRSSGWSVNTCVLQWVGVGRLQEDARVSERQSQPTLGAS